MTVIPGCSSIFIIIIHSTFWGVVNKHLLFLLDGIQVITTAGDRKESDAEILISLESLYGPGGVAP